ncbi:hypothetical protein HMPREF0322_04511 [Desulfitobacterium hafniense DP7]|uniref:Uncharacterized protein n=1 Tax=Desulfitobacterium hafniense DP7 TaxID=537010 RepID=G9XU53_DESHA|nr:hypothetical protein [Desulfitobacterium hafniense]EHL04836.1 hypothetical protein HMPREF0322_04511 [Desulfitobacterium hafniense DP7]
MEDKAAENCAKTPLVSPDVLQTKDFVFSPIKPLDRIGDSGALFLAKLKTDRRKRYLVKHAFCASFFLAHEQQERAGSSI